MSYGVQHCGPKLDSSPVGRADAPNRRFREGGGPVFCFLFCFLSPSDVLRLRSSGSKYNASTIDYVLVYFYTST